MEHPRKPSTVEGCVAYVVTLMTTVDEEHGERHGQSLYRRGETDKELAEAWDLSVSRIHDLTAEASRRVRAEHVEDRDFVVATVGVALERIVREGMGSRDPQDRRNVIQAGKTWLEVAGAAAPQRHELTGAGGAPLGSPPEIAAIWDKAQHGDPDALAAVERWIATGELPRKPSGSGAGSSRT